MTSAVNPPFYIRLTCLLAFCALSMPYLVQSQGKVYLVLGSDTAIWDNMDVAQYHCHYNIRLYTSPQDNAYAVMDPAFRDNLVDSYGQTVKMTWWMMAGNIFRYAVNTDVPVPNIMTLSLMKQYHGDRIMQWGDELTLHYHTFVWSDYNRDGKYYWNQARSFNECRDDFDYTIAQFLLEEEVFPVSFRSGWHYMDNEWQSYLNGLLPFNLDDDYPNVRKDTIEPIDNVYDWSKSSKDFVPFHPAVTNYQLPGDGKGWNVRSIHMGNVSQALMDQIFSQAAAGIDQVPCLWAHLPEPDFLANIKKIDSLAHTSAARYPTVQFRYCTAVEAMQRWLQSTDHTPPHLVVTQNIVGDNATFTVSTDKPIFQRTPFFAAKNIYEQYVVVPCDPVDPFTWKTSIGLPTNTLAKIGVAVTDTVGNVSTKIIRYLPDDVYVDNTNTRYAELSGNWSSSTISAWGNDSRIAILGGDDTVRTRWDLPVNQSGRYSLFVQVPAVANAAGKIGFRILSGQTLIDSAFFPNPLPGNEWVYIGSPMFDQAAVNTLEMRVAGSGQQGMLAIADVVKLTPLVRDREIVVPASIVDFGSVCLNDTASTTLRISNRGIGTLTVLSISTKDSRLVVPNAFPVQIPAMDSIDVPLLYCALQLGSVQDTLFIVSDDPTKSQFSVFVSVAVVPYFRIADNDDSLSYAEYGSWHTSNAQAIGRSSRFSYLTDSPGSSAMFKRMLQVAGNYDIYEIVPATTNAANKALYIVSASGRVVDSVYMDQNKGSGSWTKVGTFAFAAGAEAMVKIVNTGASTSGAVLRADAFKFALVQEATSADNSRDRDIPRNFALDQNYPNPFNPATTIRFELPARSRVRLEIMNILGQTVDVLVDAEREAGYYQATWYAKVSSGIYLCLLYASPMANPGNQFREVRKMVLVK